MDKIKNWLPAIGAGIVFAANMLLNIPNLPTILGLPLAVWLIFGLLIAQIIILSIQLANIENTHPNVFPDADGFDKLESAFPLWQRGVPSNFQVKRFFLVLRNKKVKGRTTIDTDPVHASVSFYNMDRKELTKLSHEKPFWFNFKPRIERRLAEDHNVIIKASSEPEGVCLVIRKEGDRNLYVFSDDSYSPGTSNIVFNDSLKVPTDQVYVCVKLSAGNLDLDPIWILLTNHGKNKQPEFELLDAQPSQLVG